MKKKIFEEEAVKTNETLPEIKTDTFNGNELTNTSNTPDYINHNKKASRSRPSPSKSSENFCFQRTGSQNDYYKVPSLLTLSADSPLVVHMLVLTHLLTPIVLSPSQAEYVEYIGQLIKSHDDIDNVICIFLKMEAKGIDYDFISYLLNMSNIKFSEIYEDKDMIFSKLTMYTVVCRKKGIPGLLAIKYDMALFLIQVKKHYVAFLSLKKTTK